MMIQIFTSPVCNSNDYRQTIMMTSVRNCFVGHVQTLLILNTLLSQSSHSSLGFVTNRPPSSACVVNKRRPATGLQSSSSSLSVQVYDSVVPPDTCLALHQLAVEFSDRNEDGSSIFIRPPHNAHPLTPLEHAMNRILTELDDRSDDNYDDETVVVEYWWRDEYMNIDVHSDIDECLLEDEGRLSLPDIGHVLYLQVMEELRGPTCVVSQYSGWKSEAVTTEMVTVPAVQGRLLRFPGSAMHGVPKPMDRWLLSDKEEQALRDEDAEEELKSQEAQDDESQDWEDDDDDETAPERSVLLFNCWSKLGPTGVTRDCIGGTFPDGVEIDDAALNYMAQQEAEIRLEWVDEFGSNGEELACHLKSGWISQQILEPPKEDEEEAATIRVSLMGKKNRRLYPKKNVKLRGPVEAFRKAVQQESTPTRFVFTNDEPQ
jgi:hypothetical protein